MSMLLDKKFLNLLGYKGEKSRGIKKEKNLGFFYLFGNNEFSKLFMFPLY